VKKKDKWGAYDVNKQTIYTPRLKKNVPPLTCYNLDIHGSITIIFGTGVTEKVGNQNVLYFPTSPNLCFCTTWGNRKPENCVFSLKSCMLSYQKTHETHQNITWLQLNHPSLSKRSTECTSQDLESCCVTHMLYVNQVCHCVGRCVKDGSCSSSSLSESQWTVLMGHLTISTNVDAIKHITDDNYSFRKTAHWCTVHVAQSNCCIALN